MVIGESRFFKLQPFRSDISVPIISLAGYSGVWQLVHNKTGTIDYSGDIINNGDELEVKIQTVGMAEGKYTLRCKVTDSADNFTQIVYAEQIELTR